jgi:hypothetical protein
MKRRMAAVALAGALALVIPAGSHAAEVSPSAVGAALGGSWEREFAGRGLLVKTAGFTPARCAPGRFTSANRGRFIYYRGSEVGKFARAADTEILTYPSRRAAKRGLKGLKQWVTQCPGPVYTCQGCGAGPSYRDGLKRARLGRPSYGWRFWASIEGTAVYSTSIAFVKGNKVGVASYTLLDTKRVNPEGSFVVSIPKTRALAALLKQQMSGSQRPRASVPSAPVAPPATVPTLPSPPSTTPPTSPPPVVPPSAVITGRPCSTFETPPNCAPARVSAAPNNSAAKIGQFGYGQALTARCWVVGQTITDGNNSDPSDDARTFTSNLWFGIDWNGGRGYVAAAWTTKSNDHLGLPGC